MKRFFLVCGIIGLGLATACSSNNNNNSNENENSSNIPGDSSMMTSPSNATSAASSVELGNQLFNSKCAACHTVNRDVIGPALAGVTQRVSKDWIHNFVHNSTQVIASGDTTANSLYKAYNQVQMPAFSDLTDQEIDNILAYI